MEGAFFLTNWFLEGMKWIFQNVAFQHTVLTIIICTLVLKGVTLFSDIKTRKSTAKMSALQPDLDKINSKNPANTPNPTDRPPYPHQHGGGQHVEQLPSDAYHASIVHMLL